MAKKPKDDYTEEYALFTFVDKAGQDSLNNWGRLVKTWATGKNYIKKLKDANGKAVPINGTHKAVAPFDKVPKDGDVKGFLDLLKKANVSHKNGDKLKDIRFTTSKDRWDMVIRLPAPDAVHAAEEYLEEEDHIYAIPKFYAKKVFKPGAKQRTELSYAKKIDIQADRIGDYSIGVCI